MAVAHQLLDIPGLGSQSTRDFADPFLDYMSSQMPRTMHDVLRWCESAWIWGGNGTYRQACQRIIRFFLTEIEYSGASSEDETEKWKKFHSSDFKLFDVLGALGDDFISYGNSFSSIYIPFRRFLKCPRCTLIKPIGQWSYEFRDRKFLAVDPCPGAAKGPSGNTAKCRYHGELERIDRPSLDEKRVRTIRWNPHSMAIMFNPISYETKFLLRISEDVKTAVRSGDKFFLETIPWEFVETILDDKLFEFNPGVIFHMKEETIAGIRNFGWGLPRVLSTLRQIHYIQVLKRHDEAIALDYIIPLRVITPAPIGKQDPMKLVNYAKFNTSVIHMLRQRRRDPATWNILPFPIAYNAHGGEASDMSPVELKTAAVDELLNSIGIPSELYRGTLQLQAAPMALRLFTQIWGHWYSNINGWLDWSGEIVASAFDWDKCQARMKPSTMADDLELRQIQLQMAAARQISYGTAAGPLGIDMKQEIDKIMEEERLRTEAQQKFDEETANRQAQGMLSPNRGVGSMLGGPAGAAGGGAMGGAPAGDMGGGGMAGASPGDVKAQAMDLANQLVRMPYGARRQALAQIRAGSETMWALVKAQLTQVRQQAGSMGRQALEQGQI